MHTRSFYYKLLIVLTSLLLPGVAHIYSKYYIKGVVIALSYMTHLLFGIIISEYELLQNPLSIVMLVLAVLCHFFYSMFDALQLYEFTFDTPKKQKSFFYVHPASIVVLIWVIVVSISLYNHKLAYSIVQLYPYLFLMFTTIYLLTHLKSRQWRAYYVGRWCAITIIVAIMITSYLTRQLWEQLSIAIILIIIGLLFLLEACIHFIIRRFRNRRAYSWRIDVVSLISISILLLIFSYVPKYGHLPSDLLKSFHAIDRQDYEFEVDSYARSMVEPISMAISDNHIVLSVKHRNGDIIIKGYQGDYIRIEPMRYDVNNHEFQAKIEETNRVEVSIDKNKILLHTHLAQFNKRVSKMDVILYIPFQLDMEQLYIELENGSIYLTNLNQFDNIQVKGKKTNMTSLFSSGDLQLNIDDGNTYIFEHHGLVKTKTMSGHIMLNNILSEIDVETLNGNILISLDNMYKSINAHAGVGHVQITMPPIIAYSLQAKSSFGHIMIRGDIQENRDIRSNYITKKHINIYADQNIVID